MSLRPVARASVVQEVARTLRGLLLRGHWAPGSRLPAERQLAVELGVNRTSLRHALKQLEHEGLLRSRQGDGTIVLDPTSSAGLSILAHVFTPGTLDPETQATLLADVLEFRRIVGRELAALAAERATEADVASLRALTERARDPALDAPALLALDVELYLALAHVTQNRVFELLANSVRQAIEGALPALAALLVDATVIRHHHDELVGAIARHDRAEAVRVADAYLARPQALLPPRR